MPLRRFSRVFVVFFAQLLFCGYPIGTGNTASAQSVEVVVLDEQNWDQFAPIGKEVDAIYGDIVLRNDQIIAVIARPVAGRNANLTVKDVGAAVIDLTSRDQPNDQLSCFYPGGRSLTFHDPEAIQVQVSGNGQLSDSELPCQSDEAVEIVFQGETAKSAAPVELRYRLESGDAFLTVTTSVQNTTEEPLAFDKMDSIRADRTFAVQVSDDKRLISAYDPWFHQAYGIFAAGEYPQIIFERDRNKKKVVWKYAGEADEAQEIASGESVTWSRHLMPARDPLQLGTVVDNILESEGKNIERIPVTLEVTDGTAPVKYAKVVLRRGGRYYADAQTDDSGKLVASLPPDNYGIVATAEGRERFEIGLIVNKAFKSISPRLEMEKLGVIKGVVTDSQGKPLPCKIGFYGMDKTSDPFFGPDSLATPLQNIVYSADGTFQQPIGPGQYEVIVSHGPEYDADIQPVEVRRGEVVSIESKLERSVDTTGWVSTEFHSHSSESGDNTSDQRGRVLNLLAEHIEFAPCTEHNRVDSYVPHLEALGALDQLATCPGIELTGSPLPINHQNAFPMILRPRTQDGGGPTTHMDPTVQIERLKFWDDNSEKLMQMNHPNLISILGDRDSNNEADEGFERMFGFVDVVEVHPLASVFDEVTELPQPGKGGNVVFNWMQLLNQGYRIPGVINADAHYNFHGSGFRRNFVRCSTDEPAEIDTMEMVRNSSAGKIVMSNGPFLSVQARGNSLAENSEISAQIGDEMAVDQASVKLDVKVQCPNWLDINRVQVVVNGRLVPDLDFTRRETEGMFSNDGVKFEQTIEVPLKEDAHVIVIAAGERLKLGRVMGPVHGELMPIAISNPIYIDVDGDGFQPNKDTLGAPILMPTKQ